MLRCAYTLLAITAASNFLPLVYHIYILFIANEWEFYGWFGNSPRCRVLTKHSWTDSRSKLFLPPSLAYHDAVEPNCARASLPWVSPAAVVKQFTLYDFPAERHLKKHDQPASLWGVIVPRVRLDRFARHPLAGAVQNAAALRSSDLQTPRGVCAERGWLRVELNTDQILRSAQATSCNLPRNESLEPQQNGQRGMIWNSNS